MKRSIIHFSISLSLIFFGAGWFMADSIRDLKQNPQEIKVGSIVVLGEDGSMIYCNPVDVVVNGKVTRVDTIWVKYENVSEPGFYTTKGKVRDINTKDIPHVTEQDLDSIDAAFIDLMNQ